MQKNDKKYDNINDCRTFFLCKCQTPEPKVSKFPVRSAEQAYLTHTTTWCFFVYFDSNDSLNNFLLN